MDDDDEYDNICTPTGGNGGNTMIMIKVNLMTVIILVLKLMWTCHHLHDIINFCLLS